MCRSCGAATTTTASPDLLGEREQAVQRRGSRRGAVRVVRLVEGARERVWCGAAQGGVHGGGALMPATGWALGLRTQCGETVCSL